MCPTVDEVIAKPVVSLEPTTPRDAAVRTLVGHGVTCAPVVDKDGRPLGVILLSDLLPHEPGRSPVLPAATIDAREDIREAGRRLAASGFGRLVVVSPDGRAIGVVSAVDVMRALLGLPTAHRVTSSYFDPPSRVAWSEEEAISIDGAAHAPEGGGVLVLVRRNAYASRDILWVEATHDLRARVGAMATVPQIGSPIAQLVAAQHARYRATALSDLAARERLVTEIRHASSARQGDDTNAPTEWSCIP
jgi:CBS domain-containing protein